jgi:hypothetical protein
MVVFWVVAPCCLVELYRYLGPFPSARLTHRPDDGGSNDLWNVGITLPDYTVLQPRRQPSSYSPPWKPQILLNECKITYNKRKLFKEEQYSKENILLKYLYCGHTVLFRRPVVLEMYLRRDITVTKRREYKPDRRQNMCREIWRKIKIERKEEATKNKITKDILNFPGVGDKNHEIPVRIAGVRADIWAQDLPNTKHEC